MAGRKALKKSIRSAKRSSWRRFCEETNSLEATSKLKRILVKKRSQKLGYLRLQKAMKKRQTICLKCTSRAAFNMKSRGRLVHKALNQETGI